MRAALAYRSQESDQRSSLRWSAGEEEKSLPSLLASAPGSQDPGGNTDVSASGRDGQVQSQSALKILQQQLESFQALRQQTLQNVQTEISEILNKNITDMKTPGFSLNNLPLSTTAMSKECQEASHFKKQLHLDKQSGTSQCPKINSSSIFGKTMTGENIPHQIWLKYKSIEKAEKHAQTSRNKDILGLNNDHKLKNYINSTSYPSCVGLESEEKAASSEVKKYNQSKVSMAVHQYNKESDEHLTESMSFSLRDKKEECKKTPRHELLSIFELQNSSSILCGKDNDSGYLSEQDLAEKATDMSNEDFKSKRISDLEESVGELPIATVSSKGNIQSTAEAEFEREYQSKELFIKGNVLDTLQLNFSSEVMEDKLIISELTEERNTDKLKLLSTHQFCDVSDYDYAKKDRLSQMSQRESGHLQKKVMDLEHENGDLRKQIKPLADIIQSLTEQNAKYQKQITDLHDEKNDIQGRLVKSDADCKECLKEVKRLLKKCKELQQQKSTLEGKQDELYAQNQCMMQNLNYFQKKDQNTQESLATLAQEKNDLAVALETFGNQISTFQEENKTLGEKLCQLTDNKSLLEQELGEKQNEIQQLKDNEKTAVSDLENLLTVTQSLKDEKLNLGQILQESLNVKEVLQKELEEAQIGRANAEEKHMAECKNARMEIGVLQTNLSNMERECERLRTVVADVTEDNWLLKKGLHEYKQEALECKSKVRKLSEEVLLMENKMRTTENERDVLQFEVYRLRRNTAYLRDQLIALVKEQYKRYNSGSQGQNQLADSTEICEEISSYQYFALIHDLPECGKTAKIRSKWKKKELCIKKKQNYGKQRYSAFSVNCTTSVIRELNFQTATRKKYSALCSAT
ncbi:coiled-coil domain-containing protein 110 isoform X2 [Hemicordylus capensis]|uniref:coiled-coil domain-containing protein 110 isoform X2 n=1 Tax=Hemicordylus capensis TaxID=884348 RepID=UPI002303B7DF|nr:coiled-coil domain-containing protein 110 isoform X2 [Hemicordylus capensis]